MFGNRLFNMPLNYAYDEGIGVRIEKTSETIDCVSFVEQNTLFVNLNVVEQKELPFQLAHEIGHFLTEKKSILYKQKSKTYKHKFEYEANVAGLKVLLPMYLSLTEYTVNSIYPIMEQLKIPLNLSDEVTTILKKELL